MKIEFKNTLQELTLLAGFSLIGISVILFGTSNWDSWDNSFRSIFLVSIASLITIWAILPVRISKLRATYQSLLAVISSLLFMGSVAVVDVGGKNSLISILVGLSAAFLFYYFKKGIILQVSLFLYLVVVGISAIEILMSSSRDSSLWQSVFIAVIGFSSVLSIRSSDTKSLFFGFLGLSTIILAIQLMYRNDHTILGIAFSLLVIILLTIEYRSKKSLSTIAGISLVTPPLIGQAFYFMLEKGSDKYLSFLVAGVTFILMGILSKKLRVIK